MSRGECKEIPHGPYEPCTCDGCWGDCTGRVVGCECDIDWEHVYGRHTIDCEYSEEVPYGRCESCEHGMYMHDSGGRCWFTVEQGVPEMNLVCACLIREVEVDV